MWTFKDREAGTFLDNFDGRVVKAGFVEGLISGDKTRTGKPVTTQQLFLLWHPLDQEANDQPAWYGMGKKGFTFGGNTEAVTVGTKELELYERIIDGPKLNTKSRLGIFLDKLESLGFSPDSDSAKVFIGLKCHLKRERYEGSGIESERETPMPVSLLSKPGTPAPAVAEDEVDDIVLSLVTGKSEGDIIDIAKMERIKGLGLSAAKLFKICDRLKAEGKLIYQDGVYSEPQS